MALMSHFYKALLSGGVVGDAASALRAAMMAMVGEGKWLVMQWAGLWFTGWRPRRGAALAGKPAAAGKVPPRS